MATLYKVLKRDIKNAQSHYQLDVAENRLERGRENKTISTAQGRKLETFLSNKEMELDSGHHYSLYWDESVRWQLSGAFWQEGHWVGRHSG